MLQIDVVVLTRNSAKTIGQCLDAIKRTTDASALIIIDDSNDGGETVRIARKYTDKISVYSGNIGEKRDHAIDLVTAPIFAFVDSDVIINSKAFVRSVEIMRSNDLIAAVHSGVRPADPRDFVSGETKQNLTFGFALLRTMALRESRIPHRSRGEDPATGMRLKRLGYEVVWQGEFVCLHMRTLVDTWRHYLQYGRRGHFEGHPVYVVRKLVRQRDMKTLVLQLCFLAGYTEYRVKRLGRQEPHPRKRLEESYSADIHY